MRLAGKGAVGLPDLTDLSQERERRLSAGPLWQLSFLTLQGLHCPGAVDGPGRLPELELPARKRWDHSTRPAVKTTHLRQ